MRELLRVSVFVVFWFLFFFLPRSETHFMLDALVFQYCFQVYDFLAWAACSNCIHCFIKYGKETMTVNRCSLWARSRRRQIAAKCFSFWALLNRSMFLRPNSSGRHYDCLRSPNFMLRHKRPEGEDFKWMKWRNLHFLKQTYSISFHVSEMKTKNTN